MGDTFHIRMAHDDLAWTMICGGELDVSSAATLEDACDLCGAMRPDSLHIDGRDLTFVDSAGVTALLRCARRCAEDGITFTIAVSEQVHDVLGRTGLLERLVLGKPAVPSV